MDLSTPEPIVGVYCNVMVSRKQEDGVSKRDSALWLASLTKGYFMSDKDGGPEGLVC